MGDFNEKSNYIKPKLVKYSKLKEVTLSSVNNNGNGNGNGNNNGNGNDNSNNNKNKGNQ
ncbi:MAG: hypothetical protein ABF289_00095 [Clostridiales bacterium]